MVALASRLMERNPLQAVATMKVMKLNQMHGMDNMFITETFFFLRPSVVFTADKRIIFTCNISLKTG